MQKITAYFQSLCMDRKALNEKFLWSSSIGYRLFRYPFKNSAFEKCFKSACILKLSLEHFKMNCMFLRDFKMRKKSKFEKYISIIIDSLASALKNVLILRGRCTLGLMDYKMVGQWTKDSLSRLHRHSYWPLHHGTTATCSFQSREIMVLLLGAQFALNLINVFHPHREMVRNIKVNPPQGRTIFFTAKVVCVHRDARPALKKIAHPLWYLNFKNQLSTGPIID